MNDWHPSDTELRAFRDDTLAPEASTRVDFHLAAAGDNCLVCRPRFEALLHEPPERWPVGTLVGGKYRVEDGGSKGGQGVVYKARWVELDRIVAVKTIPPERLRYFRTEAQTLASLTHQNIVPILDWGEHEGQPYFVMEYLPGGSLSGDRLPANRAAEVVETLARAVHFAHTRPRKKIIHRDLKPANVLRAESGDWKITDYGLALVLSESDEKRDVYGPASGTPDYMAPEQEDGRGDAIQEPTDVYALCAILYQLLTGELPRSAVNIPPDGSGTTGTERPEKVSPRLVRTNVPGALAGICLKGLRNDPKARYGTAEDLAEDLRRYRDRELTRAWPVGRLRRRAEGTRLWVVRNPGAFAAMVLLTAFAVCAAWATWYFIALAEENHGLAIQRGIQRDRAEQLADIARKAFSQSLERIGRKPLSAMTRDEKVPTRLLTEALAFFEAYKGEIDQDPGRRFESGQTRRWIGDVLQLLGRDEDAGKAYVDAESFLSGVGADGAMSARQQQELARLHNNFGILHQEEDDFPSAEKEFVEAVDLRRQLAEPPLDRREYRFDYALALNNLANFLHDRRSREKDADAAYAKSAALLKELADTFPKQRMYSEELAETYEAWAEVFKDKKDLDNKTTHYLQAIRLFDHLAEDPQDRDARDAQSRVRNSLGVDLMNADRLSEAEPYLREARDETKQTAKDFDTEVADEDDIKTSNETLETLAVTYGNDALDLTDEGKWDEAEAAYRNAIRIFTDLSKEPSSLPDLNRDVVDHFLGLGRMFILRQEPDRAEQIFREAYKSVKALPDGTGDRRALGEIRNAFGELTVFFQVKGAFLRGEGRFDEALAPYRKSVSLLEDLQKEFPEGGATFRQNLAVAREFLGLALQDDANAKTQTGPLDEARDRFREAASAFGQAYDDFSTTRNDKASPGESALLESVLGINAGRQGACLEQLGELPQALARLQTSFDHLQKALQLDNTKPAYETLAQQCAVSLTGVQLKMGDYPAFGETVKKLRRQLGEYVWMDGLAASLLSQGVLSVETDRKLAEATRDALIREYGHEAVGALRDSIRKSYDEKNIAFEPAVLNQLGVLAPLSKLDEFKALVAEREEKLTLPALGASTAGLLGSPLGQGPLLAASTLIPGRAKKFQASPPKTPPKQP